MFENQFIICTLTKKYQKKQYTMPSGLNFRDF